MGTDDDETTSCRAETVDAECARVRCQLTAGHAGLHDDGNGTSWRSPGTEQAG